MRGHLVQGPSLDCQSGDLTGKEAPSLPAHPHTGLPSCSTAGHASHFPTPLNPHLQNALPLPWLSPDLDWMGTISQVNKPSLGGGAVPVALPTILSLRPGRLLPRHAPSTTSDSTDANSIPMGLRTGDRPLPQWQGGHPPPVPMHLPLQGHSRLQSSPSS